MQFLSQSHAAILYRTLRQTQDEGLDKALQREADAQALCYASKEFRERLQSLVADMTNKKGEQSKKK